MDRQTSRFQAMNCIVTRSLLVAAVEIAHLDGINQRLKSKGWKRETFNF